jgi:hypothetical protein
MVVKIIEKIAQNGRRSCDAGNAPHGQAVKIPHPNSHGEFGRVTKSPIVLEIRGLRITAPFGKIFALWILYESP